MLIARGTMTVILAFMPSDTMQLMVAGQAVLFNALSANAAYDMNRGMKDGMKLRAQAQATAMGRLASKHIDTLIKLQGRLPTARKAKPAEETEAETDTAERPSVKTPAPEAPRAPSQTRPIASREELSAAMTEAGIIRPDDSAPLPPQPGPHPPSAAAEALARKLAASMPSAIAMPQPVKPPATG